MKRPSWISYSQEKEIRKTLITSKLQACKDVLTIAQNVGEKQKGFGLKMAKDYVDTLSGFKDPYEELGVAVETIEKMEESLDSLLREIMPNASDSKIRELLADRNRMKNLSNIGETSNKFNI